MLSTSHRQYIIKHFVISSGVINALLNGAIAYALFAGQGPIAIWGEPSFGADIIATIFLLTLITSLLVNWGTALAILHFRVDPLEGQGFLSKLEARLPEAAWPRALLFSVMATAIVAPLVLYSLHLLAIQSLSSISAIAFKTLFAVLLGWLVTPFIGVLALSKPVASECG